MKTLEKLIGTWTGTGIAKYPTIETINYAEELTFSTNNYDQVLHYEQKTWVIDKALNRVRPIFWECGFIIEKEEGLMLVNTQKSGRMENMAIHLEELENGRLIMIATSKAYLNDPRMISSKRIFTISDEMIEYELRMVTTLAKVDDQSDLHLKAVLKRKE